MVCHSCTEGLVWHLSLARGGRSEVGGVLGAPALLQQHCFINSKEAIFLAYGCTAQVARAELVISSLLGAEM